MKKKVTKARKAILALGEKVFIRTVTHYYTGRVIRVSKDEIELESAAWIADTKRFADTLRLGELSEVEPYPDRVLIGRGAVVDICTWLHDLPTEQK